MSQKSSKPISCSPPAHSCGASPSSSSRTPSPTPPSSRSWRLRFAIAASVSGRPVCFRDLRTLTAASLRAGAVMGCCMFGGYAFSDRWRQAHHSLQGRVHHRIRRRTRSTVPRHLRASAESVYGNLGRKPSRPSPVSILTSPCLPPAWEISISATCWCSVLRGRSSRYLHIIAIGHLRPALLRQAS